MAARRAAVRKTRNTSPRAPAGALSTENKYASVSMEQPEIPSCDSVLKLDHDKGQGWNPKVDVHSKVGSDWL